MGMEVEVLGVGGLIDLQSSFLVCRGMYAVAAGSFARSSLLSLIIILLVHIFL